MLTDSYIRRKLTPRGTAYRVADAQGLCLEVRPSGSKVWRYRYRHSGKASMVTLEPDYPDLSLAGARAECNRLRALVRGGANPAQVARIKKETQASRATSTFASVAFELLAKREKEGMGSGSVLRERRLIERDLAALADIPVADVSAPALLSALRKLECRGVIETAHRARSLAGRVFRYAIATGRAERNPAADLVGALQQPQGFHFASLTDPARIADLLRAIHGYSGAPVTVAALRLAPLVFVRPGELRRALWADIDLDAGVWNFTASKSGTPHTVPLATQAIAILRDLQPLTGRADYVFPSVRGRSRPMSENTINAALRTMGFDGDTMTAHGFRAMARTVLDEVLGFRADFIEHQLAHAVRDPLGRAYNRTQYLPERKKMMQAWADYLDSLRTNANVTPIKRRA